MYSDLFDQLGAAGGVGRRGGGGASAAPPAVPPLVSFKAGKMIMTMNASEEGSNTYKCEPDTKRGEVRMIWQDNALKWQFYDRRDKVVKESHTIPPSSGSSTTTTISTLERVPLADKKHKKDRIYLWTRPDGTFDMYWMQDASEEKEDEIVATVNQYLADPASAAPVVTSSTTGTGASGTAFGAAMGASSGSGGGRGGGGGGGPNQNQVDALSSILENLGMPQGGSGDGVTGSAMTSSAAAAAAGPTGTLTLADLQGAMASMPQQAASAARPATVLPLSEIITPAAISSLLEQEEVCNRLLELLPEEQRSRKFLEENLRSPQIQQTLRSLTQALLPDDTGNMDGFYSVLANFQLDPAAGQAAMVGAGGIDPIQAFLDCLLASVEKEEQGGGGEDTNMANNNDKDEGKDGSGDGEEKQQDQG